MHFIVHWMDAYGYYVLILFLMLEMLALPLPGFHGLDIGRRSFAFPSEQTFIT